MCYLVEVEDQIQLANVTEVSVQNLHEMMNYLQHLKFIVLLVHNRDEVQTRIPTV